MEERVNTSMLGSMIWEVRVKMRMLVYDIGGCRVKGQ